MSQTIEHKGGLYAETGRRGFLKGVGKLLLGTMVTPYLPSLSSSLESYQTANLSMIGDRSFSTLESLRAIATTDLRLAGKLSLALLQSPQSNPERSDSEMILRPLVERVWTTDRWWPIFTERGIQLGLPKLHDDWWSAHLYDLMYRDTGGSSDIQEQAKRKADTIIRTRPDTRNSAGYCPWVSIAQLLEEKPEAFPGENWFGETDPEKIVAFKEGILALKHAGDILIPVPTTANTLRYTVEREFPVIVDLPANLGSGNWFRSLLGVSEDGNLVRVTNFGHPHADLSISGITQAYIVYLGSANASFAPGIKEATSFWRYDNLDGVFIDKLVYGR